MGDEPDVVEAVDEVREAARGEQERELVGRVRLVGGDEPVCEPGERGAVLGAEEPSRCVCTRKSAFSG
jgi:hypothetical protein